jgi:hypothetical protein
MLTTKDRDPEADAKTVKQFVDILKSINELKTLDWIYDRSVNSSFVVLSMCTNAPILKENRELQQEVSTLLESLGKVIARNPYSIHPYYYWSGLSAIAKSPDPLKLLNQIKFYPISATGYAVHDFVSKLAEPFFNNPLATEDFKPILGEGIKFLDDGAQWMLEQEPYLDGIFAHAYTGLAVTKAQRLIQFHLYPELEKHLEDTWQMVGPGWADVAGQLKNPDVKMRERDISDLPRATRKRVDDILAQPPKPKVAKTPNVAAGDASGISEEHKNLDALERFIKLNPDAWYAMDMYCRDAAKFLPDEDLEKNIYNYTRITYNPPSLAAYSKMQDKENWARLASRVISDGLGRLKDAPSSGWEKDSWLNLSRWEDLDLEKNAVDWYGFIKNNVFWYHPMYYVTRNGMPEDVFVKYLGQAEKAMDWASVLAACEARYNLDKKNCQSETILKAWKQAEEKMNR